MPPDDFDPHHAFGKLLSHPRVQAFLTERVAPYGLPEADSKDIIAQVLAALWRRRDEDDLPDNLNRLLGLARTVFEGKLVDYFRRKDVERGRIVDGARLMGKGAELEEPPRHNRPHEQPNHVDEILPQRSMTPADALEAKEQLAFVQTQLDKGVLTHDDIEVMQSQHAGEQTYEELGAERGVSADALRQRIHRIRMRMLKAWTEYSLFTKTWMIVFFILLFLVIVTVIAAALRRKEPPPAPPPPPAPTQTQLPPAPTAPLKELPPTDDKGSDKPKPR
jgi:RNA polymerase sigma factor (sigma-70 family)